MRRDDPPELPRDSVLATIAGEPVLMLGAQRALLLQIANPKIAAGVAQHSDYRRSPVRRLAATLDMLIVLLHGRPSEARAVLSRVHDVHDGVRGEVPADDYAAVQQDGRPRDSQPGPASSPRRNRYSAQDPQLQAWVLATLIDTVDQICSRWIRPLDYDEAARCYEDWRAIARCFGGAAHVLPPDLPGFRAWFGATLDSDQLRVGETARAIASDLVRPKLRFPTEPIAAPMRCVTTALLPERLRRDYGLRFGRPERALFGAIDIALQRGWSLPLARRGFIGTWLLARRLLHLGPAPEPTPAFAS